VRDRELAVELEELEVAVATSLTSVTTTPRRASSVARYCARAVSVERRMRPQTSISHAALNATWKVLKVVLGNVGVKKIFCRSPEAWYPTCG